MISAETAAALWNCHREINAGQKLLADLAEFETERVKCGRADPKAASLPDAFGRMRPLQLGIPSGDASHRCFNVAPQLAEAVIKAHIATQRAELAALNQAAALEAATDEPTNQASPQD